MWVTNKISNNEFNTLNDVYFINADTGFVAQYGKVFRTIDGGTTWSSQVKYENWYRIQFPSDSIGYIAGRNGKILKTTNAGIDWIRIQTIVSYPNFYTLKFFNDSTGYFFGGAAIKTTDGGISWIQLAEPTPATNIYSQYFFNEMNGIIVGQGGRIFSTADGCLSWNNRHPGLQTDLRELTFINDSSGFLITEYSLLKSNDFFRSWNEKTSVSSSMQCYSFPTENIGYLIWATQIFKSVDAGETWNFNSDLPGAFAIDFVNQWLGFCVGVNNKIWKTTDGGELWTSVNQYSNSFDLLSIDMGDALRGCAVGEISMTYYTTDGGDNWTMNNFYPTFVEFSRVKMFNHNFGLACGILGEIYKTTSTGSNWSSKPSPVSTRLMDIHFINQDTVFIVGDRGVILLSTDSGENWDQQPSPTNQDLKSIYFVNPDLGFIVGNEGVILKYGDLSTTIDTKTHRIALDNYRLYQNYPNPFNPITTLQYTISDRQDVSLRVYDFLGREITTLVTEEKPAGSYEVKFDATRLPAGIYFYSLRAGSFFDTKKMILLK